MQNDCHSHCIVGNIANECVSSFFLWTSFITVFKFYLSERFPVNSWLKPNWSALNTLSGVMFACLMKSFIFPANCLLCIWSSSWFSKLTFETHACIIHKLSNACHHGFWRHPFVSCEEVEDSLGLLHPILDMLSVNIVN